MCASVALAINEGDRTVPRIDQLHPGDIVDLEYDPQTAPHIEKAVFLRYETQGEEGFAVSARFLSISSTGKAYEFDLYRYQDRWAYGWPGTGHVRLDAVTSSINPKSPVEV